MTQVFISYAHKDLRKVEAFLERFKPVLDAFSGTVTIWMDHEISAGSHWSRDVDDAIDQSDIFFLFVTDRSIGSEYMLKTEWPKIQLAKRRRDALVVPIILEDGFWRDHFADDQCIPHTDADRQLKPISSWKPQADGYLAAARACRDAVVKYLKRPPRPPKDLPGPAMEATQQGLKLKTVPGKAAELRDPDQLSLHGEIRQLMTELRAELSPQPGRNAGSSRLLRALDAYARQVDLEMRDLDPARVWTAGVDLGITIDRLLTSEDHGIGETAIEDLERLLRRAETFSMGFETGRKLQSRARLHRDLSPDRKATLRGSTDQVLSGMRDEPGLLTPDTSDYFGAVLDAMRDAYGDPNPETLASALEPAVRTGIEALVAVGKAASRASLGPAAPQRAHPVARLPAKPKSRGARVTKVPAAELSSVIASARAFLTRAQGAVEQFAGTQSEIRRFTLGILERFGVGTYGIKVPKDYIELAEMGLEPLPKDFDYEDEATKLILAGKAPPREWVPKIRNLYFWGESGLTDLSPLSDLTGLRTLYVNTTGVTDLSPLSGLTALRVLDVNTTGVTDLSPLSGLTALTALYVRQTGATDLSPLSGLTALTELNVSGTGVTDLSPLSGLTALTELYVSHTGVTDLSPLSGLTALTTLSVGGTGVPNLSLLSGLTALTALYVSGTGVSDLSPLSGLSALTALYVSGTGVSDLSPLSGLSALTELDVSLTKVTDISAIKSLPNLKTIIWAGRDSVSADFTLPAQCEELVLLGRPWSHGIPLPEVKYRIDPDGTVHDPDGKASDWFNYWARHAARFRETGKLPGED